MNTTKKTISALVLVAALLVAGVAPATAALTYDNETTDSASTSDLVGGETLTDLGNSSKMKTIQVISDNASTSSLTAPEDEFKLELNVSDANSDETNRTFYTNTSATWNVVNSSAGHYSVNVSHADLFAELERDINENVTVDVAVTFNESETDAETSTITVYAQNGETDAVEVVSDADLKNENGVETFNETKFWIRDDVDYSSVESDKSISNNTTISYVFANDTVASDYTSAYDAGSFSAGDYIPGMIARAEAKPIMVFDSKKGDKIDVGTFSGGFLPDEDSYAVYENNGGEFGENPSLEIVPQGDHADKASLEVSSAGNKELGFWSTFKHFGLNAARAGGW